MVHLQREVDNLRKKLLHLAAIVEEDVKRAVLSVKERNTDLAEQVIESDYEIDNMEIQVEEDCLKVFALYQPVAVDLRYIVSVLKINNDLERIGDLAVNIAERTKWLAGFPDEQIPEIFTQMASKSQWMLKKSIDSFVNLNMQLARAVLTVEDEVDAYLGEMHDYIKHGIQQTPAKMDFYIDILAVAKNLERMADHATNIAEDVIYMIEGEIVRHTPFDLLPES